jgi:hypothetical protein
LLVGVDGKAGNLKVLLMPNPFPLPPIDGVAGVNGVICPLKFAADALRAGCDGGGGGNVKLPFNASCPSRIEGVEGVPGCEGRAGHVAVDLVSTMHQVGPKHPMSHLMVVEGFHLESVRCALMVSAATQTFRVPSTLVVSLRVVFAVA